MLLTFSQDRNHVLFLTQTSKDISELAKFPGLTRMGDYRGAKSVLPIVYNLYQRAKTHFTKVDISTTLKEWLDTPFQLKPIPDDFQYYTTPLDFQRIALRFLYTLGSAGLLLDPGMGKSKVVLDYIYLQSFKKSIVVCPSPLLFVWEDEIAKHRPELTFHTITTTDWTQHRPQAESVNVTIINYSKAVILKDELKAVGYDFIHLDEFLIKDPKSQRTKTLTLLSEDIPFKCGGSGTLINNSPMDVFCPSRYLHRDLTGGNYYTFFEKYAVTKQSSRPNPNSVEAQHKVVVGFRQRPEIKSVLESCCIVMTKEVWLKLPNKHFHDVIVQMGDNQRAAFNHLAANRQLSIAGEQILADNALSLMSKLYQISQGFIYAYPEKPKDEANELLAALTPSKKVSVKKKVSDRRVLFFKQQPKADALHKLITQTVPGQRAIIWFNLSSELEIIEKTLLASNKTYLVIQGGDKEIGTKVRNFNKTPNIDYLVCQAKSVNYGITVLGSKEEDLDDEAQVQVLAGLDPSVFTQIFYSLNFSLEVYLQQQDRIHRLGQTHECHYYRIFCNNQVENRIRQAIEDKMSLKYEMMVDFATELLQELATDEPLTLDESILTL